MPGYEIPDFNSADGGPTLANMMLGTMSVAAMTPVQRIALAQIFTVPAEHPRITDNSFGDMTVEAARSWEGDRGLLVQNGDNWEFDLNALYRTCYEHPGVERAAISLALGDDVRAIVLPPARAHTPGQALLPDRFRTRTTLLRRLWLRRYRLLPLWDCELVTCLGPPFYYTFSRHVT
jgi:hypothetical protein